MKDVALMWYEMDKYGREICLFPFNTERLRQNGHHFADNI